MPYPVEYKWGTAKNEEPYRRQLCAQAMCLEEMLCCEIPQAYLYYGETRRRQTIALDVSLRERTAAMIAEMHELFRRQHTPKVKRTKACNACSLKDICLPVLCGSKKASDYITDMLDKEE